MTWPSDRWHDGPSGAGELGLADATPDALEWVQPWARARSRWEWLGRLRDAGTNGPAVVEARGAGLMIRVGLSNGDGAASVQRGKVAS